MKILAAVLCLSTAAMADTLTYDPSTKTYAFEHTNGFTQQVETEIIPESTVSVTPAGRLYTFYIQKGFEGADDQYLLAFTKDLAHFVSTYAGSHRELEFVGNNSAIWRLDTGERAQDVAYILFNLDTGYRITTEDYLPTSVRSNPVASDQPYGNFTKSVVTRGLRTYVTVDYALPQVPNTCSPASVRMVFDVTNRIELVTPQ